MIKLNPFQKDNIIKWKKEFLDCMSDIDLKYMNIIDETFWELLVDSNTDLNYGRLKR